MALLLLFMSLVNRLNGLAGSDNLPIVLGSLLVGCTTSPVYPSTGLSERLLRPASSSTHPCRLYGLVVVYR
jgi:hypothetical protein